MTSPTRTLAALALSLAVSAPALAQETEPTESGGAIDDGQFSAFLTTTSAATASSGGASTGVMATMLAYTPDPDGRLTMARYLTAHARGVREACALGAGYAVDDLALALGVPEARRGELARAMRAQRATLMALIDQHEVTPQRAGRFVDVLVGHLAATSTPKS
jgi:hypothetical protein